MQLTVIIKYLVTPILIGIGLAYFGPQLTYSSSPSGSISISAWILSGFFFAVGLIAAFLIYRERKVFLASGNSLPFNIAIGCVILAIFSISAAATFFHNDRDTIGWLVQVGTLASAAWIFYVSFAKREIIASERRDDFVFSYSMLAVVISSAVTWLLFIFKDFMPLVLDPNFGWGKELLWVRVISSVLFLLAGTIFFIRKEQALIVGAIFLLAVGSFGVVYVYSSGILTTHPLIWFNRVLTLLALLALLKRPNQ